MKSVMTNRFSQVPKASIPRSSFQRDYGYKTTFDAGWLIPIHVDEALPGDTHSLSLTGFARLATPIWAAMDNMFMETFFFAVPMRLLWDNWEKFNGAQDNPGDSTDYLIPQMTAPGGGYATGSLSDYLGLPTLVAGYAHSSLYHRAYYLIWNEWFRDQNLQNSLAVPTGDGPDTPANFTLQRRNKRHDYFTSCLPWPQKGNSVDIPIGVSAPISRTANAPALSVYNEATNTLVTASAVNVNASGELSINTTTGAGYSLDPNGGLFADLSSATAATINQLRQAFQVQKLLERDARGGTRYVEVIKAHFGVTSPDFRMQRPEYLGGGSSPVHINPVLTTAVTTGEVKGYGTALLSGHGFTKSFTEHCLIIGLVNVRADLTYQEGLPREFSRETRYDFYWPELAMIGEQAVLNKEIYCQGTAGGAADNNVFGYQERHAEYRYKPSRVTGLFRSNAAGTLHAWHLSQDFTALPLLNSSFIQDDPPIDRIIVTPSQPHFIYDSFVKLRSVRPMPIYGVPGLIDHF